AISKTTPTASALTVLFTLGQGATWPDDFTVTGCQIASGGIAQAVIPAGQDHVDIGIQAVDDHIVEGLEAGKLTLQPGPLYQVSATAGESTIWISDTVVLRLAAEGYNPPDVATVGVPGGNSLPIAVVAGGSVCSPLRVRLRFDNGCGYACYLSD